MNAPDQQPVLIGVGQAMEPVPDDLRRASSYAGLATLAVERALADCNGMDIRNAIDAVAAVRTFEDSLPGSKRAFDGPRKLPGAVARRLNLHPREMIYDRLGGQSPQQLVTEFATRCHRGETGVALLFGVEVIANIKAARRAGQTLDWSEPASGACHDRGGNEALELIGREALRHQLMAPMQFYGLMETARRAALGMSAEAYARAMGELFAPFSQVAAGNPYAQFPHAFDPVELITPGPDNPPLVTPYTIRLVSKDGVNQAAAVLVTTAGRARELGVPADRWIYLHGHAETEEFPLWERPRLGYSLALEGALHGAMESANTDGAGIAHLDLYSCFPVVVFNARDALGIGPGDPRPLTLTGGLPYFGGPGNNYSMHALAEMCPRLRGSASRGLVTANGGILSKHARRFAGPALRRRRRLRLGAAGLLAAA